jgi:uridine kinase
MSISIAVWGSRKSGKTTFIEQLVLKINDDMRSSIVINECYGASLPSKSQYNIIVFMDITLEDILTRLRGLPIDEYNSVVSDITNDEYTKNKMYADIIVPKNIYSAISMIISYINCMKSDNIVTQRV